MGHHSVHKNRGWAWLLLMASACSGSTSNGQIVTLAVPLPYTGELASFGFTLERAVYLAAEQVNAAGGIQGATLQIVTYDTRSSMQEGYLSASNAVGLQPFAIIGPDSAALVAANEPAASSQGILLVTPGQTYPVAGEPYPPSSTLWAQINPAIGPLASTLGTSLITAGAQRVAFCYTDDRHGQAYLRAFAETFLPSGADVNGIAFEPNEPVSQQSIAQLLAYTPDAIVLYTSPSVGADIVNGAYLQAQNEALTLPPFYLGPNLENNVFSRSVIRQALGSSQGLAPTTDDPTNAFAEAFSERWYGASAITDAFYYYDAVLYFAAHAQAAGQDAGGGLPAPSAVFSKMQTASTATNATVVSWSDIGTFLKSVQANASFVYSGVTGPIRISTNGVRTLPQPYVPASWSP